MFHHLEVISCGTKGFNLHPNCIVFSKIPFFELALFCFGVKVSLFLYLRKYFEIWDSFFFCHFDYLSCGNDCKNNQYFRLQSYNTTFLDWLSRNRTLIVDLFWTILICFHHFQYYVFKNKPYKRLNAPFAYGGEATILSMELCLGSETILLVLWLENKRIELFR